MIIPSLSAVNDIQLAPSEVYSLPALTPQEEGWITAEEKKAEVVRALTIIGLLTLTICNWQLNTILGAITGVYTGYKATEQIGDYE